MQSLNQDQWAILYEENPDLFTSWKKLEDIINDAAPQLRYQYLSQMEPEYTHYTLILIHRENERVTQAVQDMYDKFKYVEKTVLEANQQTNLRIQSFNRLMTTVKRSVDDSLDALQTFLQGKL